MSQSVSALLSAVFLLALAGTTIQQISRSNPVTATSAPSLVPAPAPDTTAVEKRPAVPSVDEVMLPPPPTIEPPPPTTQSTPMAEPKATILPLRPTQSVEPLPLLVVPLLPTTGASSNQNFRRGAATSARASQADAPAGAARAGACHSDKAHRKRRSSCRETGRAPRSTSGARDPSFSRNRGQGNCG